LLLIPGGEYLRLSKAIIKELSRKSICYITLNKTQEALEEMFRKNKIKSDNIVYVDAITKTIKSVPDQGNKAYFVSSPGALTELSLVISKFLNHHFDYLIFDSITNLMVYEKKAPVVKFIHNLAAKIKDSQTKAIFYALDVEEQKGIIQECSMFVDKVIDLSHQKK
jgi:archaellum biogenesis ATPase FlaH